MLRCVAEVGGGGGGELKLKIRAGGEGGTCGQL